MSRRVRIVALLALLTGVVEPAALQAQMFFEADAVFFNRRGGNTGGAYLLGPDAAVISGPGNSYEPGYRLVLGGMLDQWQIDAALTQVSPWEGFASGGLTQMVILDDTFGNPVVDPGGLANRLAIPNALFDAAALQFDEQTESERLQGGGNWTYYDRANYRDFEINLGSSRNMSPWRFSVGYRHIRYDGRNQFTMSGVFDAIDTADGAVFGDLTNQPNDALAGTSLIAAGMTGFGQFDALATGNGPDTLLYAHRSRADNELNGAQTTFVWRMIDSPWVTIEGIGKAGLFHNNMQASLVETVWGTGNGTAQYTRSFNDRRTGAAFAGNVGMKAILSLTDYMNLVGGYEFVFLAGLGTPGNQAYGLGTDTLGARTFRAHNSSDLVIHGGTVGVEVNW